MTLNYNYCKGFFNFQTTMLYNFNNLKPFLFFQNEKEFKQLRVKKNIKKRNNAENFHSISGGDYFFSFN